MLPLSKNLSNSSFNTMNKRLYNQLFSVSQKIDTSLKAGFSIRPLKIFEFREVLKSWTAKEGWNPGQYEYLPFYMANPNGHKGLFINNKLIASLSAVRYSKDFAFLGLYIVDPQYRDQGVGQTLAKSALEELTDCSLLGINAVQSQVSNYQRKYGFFSSYTNSRWSGLVNLKNNIIKSKTDIKIVGKKSVNVNQLIDYDASIFSVPREAFLRKWIVMPKSCLLVAMQNEKICGYGVISKCLQGYKIAPLFANGEEIAKKLYASFPDLLKKKTLIQLDIPNNNQPAIKLATQFGLYKTFETTRMYKGEDTLIRKKNDEIKDENKSVYSLTTLEIG